MSITEITDYEAVLNQAGELLFILPALEGIFERPCLYYDGGDHAVLIRAPERFFLLKHIPEALRVRLGFATRVSIQETNEDGSSSSAYSATVLFTHDIPALRGTA